MASEYRMICYTERLDPNRREPFHRDTWRIGYSPEVQAEREAIIDAHLHRDEYVNYAAIIESLRNDE
jgi:hypothetical protein